MIKKTHGKMNDILDKQKVECSTPDKKRKENIIALLPIKEVLTATSP
jgi:hypothetical protein